MPFASPQALNFSCSVRRSAISASTSDGSVWTLLSLGCPVGAAGFMGVVVPRRVLPSSIGSYLVCIGCTVVARATRVGYCCSLWITFVGRVGVVLVAGSNWVRSVASGRWITLVLHTLLWVILEFFRRSRSGFDEVAGRVGWVGGG